MLFLKIYLVIPTQFGNVPDVAFEEIKQFRAQQQQQQQLQQNGSINLSTSALISNNNINNSSNTATDINTNQNRSTARDLSINPTNGLVRSRSLAANGTIRPSVAAASTYVSNPAHQTPLFATNKQSFVAPTRFGAGRLFSNGHINTHAHPPGPSSSSTSYASNRSLPINTSPNIKHRHGNHYARHHPPSVTINSAAAATTTTTNDPQRPHYETTYRASFIKPLAP